MTHCRGDRTETTAVVDAGRIARRVAWEDELVAGVVEEAPVRETRFVYMEITSQLVR